MGQLVEVRKQSVAQKVGAKVVDGWRATTQAGDQALTGLGVKSKTGAYTAGGALGLAGGNNAARMRARRAQEKRSEVGKFDLAVPDVPQPVAKSRGVGRREKTDGMTSRAVVIRTPTLRDINGKFAGQGQGVKVFHPLKGTVRGNVHTKQLFRATKKPELVGKSVEEPRKGMLGSYDLASMQVHAGARRGRRL